MDNTIETEAKKKLYEKIDKLFEAILKEVKAPSSETTIMDISKLSLGNDIEYPDLKDNEKKEIEFFKATVPEKKWWKEDKFFIGFVLLVALSAFVFYKCFDILSNIKALQPGQTPSNQLPSGFLLFFFGVVALLFVGLVIVALCMIKSLAKHRAEKNERENKMLAFRLKMLETAFELKNRKIITEKQCAEKTLSIKEKEYLSYLDEKQKVEDNKRKMISQFFEILENYMKYVGELRKMDKEDEKAVPNAMSPEEPDHNPKTDDAGGE